MRYIIILLLLPLVTGLGIGPVQVFKVFQPGQNTTVLLQVFNNEKEETVFRMTAEGEYAHLVEFEQIEYEFTPENTSIPVTYHLKFPDEIKPGEHFINIKAQETAALEGLAAVQTQVSVLKIQAPLEEAYAEAKLEIREGNNRADFDLYVFNFGQNPITATAIVTAVDKTFDLGNKTISSMNEAIFSTGAEFDNGTHSAKAVIEYEGREIILEKEFTVGVPNIEVLDITVASFKLGEVAEIKISMKNHHNIPLDVYGTIDIGGQTIDTETFTIENEKEIVTYWDSAGKEKGVYPATLTLHYGAKTVENFEIEVKDTGQILVLAYILIAIMVAWAVFWVVKGRKKEQTI